MVADLFAQFIKEKRYVANLSERTIHSYENHVFKRWMKYVGEMPTKQNLTQFVVKMREAGLSVATCNITIRSFNSFLSWLSENGHEPLKVQQLKAEKRIMKTFTEDQMRTLLKWRPGTSRNEVRLWLFLCEPMGRTPFLTMLRIYTISYTLCPQNWAGAELGIAIPEPHQAEY